MMMRCCRSLGPWTAIVVQGKPGGLSWLAQVRAFTCRNALDMDMLGSLGREGAFAFHASCPRPLALLSRPSVHR